MSSLGVSITPKLHCLEAHLVYLLRKHRGFSDLGENAGEQAHQTKFWKDSRLAAQRSHDRREAAKSANEVKDCDPRVQQKEVKQMYEKMTVQGAKKRKATVEANRDKRRQEKILRQEPVFGSDPTVLEGRVYKFSEQRVAKFRPLEGTMNSNI